MTCRLWLKLTFALFVAMLLGSIGCQSDPGESVHSGRETTRIPPLYGTENPVQLPETQSLVGTWSGLPASVEVLGLDEMRIFIRANRSYTFYTRFASVEIREHGQWRSTPDSIRFRTQFFDDFPVDSSYALWYRLTREEDTLRIRYLFDQPYTVVYVRE